MKKWFCILMAVVMMGVAACTALADPAPQPEGGKKFESVWVIGGGLAEIVYEEEGYKINLDIQKNDGTGSEFEYSCYYKADTDSLLSVSSYRMDYTYDSVTGKEYAADPAYDGDDDEKQATEFTIDKDGFLIWKDGRDDAGAGLKFKNIGKFEGVWKNDAEAVRAEIRWNGKTDDELFYTVYLTRGKTDGDRYEEFVLNMDYDSSTGKLSGMGTCTVFTKNAAGEYDSQDDAENHEFVFSMTEDGKVCDETDNGVLLEFTDNWVG